MGFCSALEFYRTCILLKVKRYIWWSEGFVNILMTCFRLREYSSVSLFSNITIMSFNRKWIKGILQKERTESVERKDRRNKIKWNEIRKIIKETSERNIFFLVFFYSFSMAYQLFTNYFKPEIFLDWKKYKRKKKKKTKETM